MGSKLFIGRDSSQERDHALAAARQSAFYQASHHIEDGKQYRITCFGAHITDEPGEKTNYFHAECEMSLREEIEASKEDAHSALRAKILTTAFDCIKTHIDKAEKDIKAKGIEG